MLAFKTRPTVYDRIHHGSSFTASHVTTAPLSNSLLPSPTQVNADHPIVKEARRNGNTLFVIASMFLAEHCNVEVSFSEKIEDSARATVQAGGYAQLTEGGSVDDSKSTFKGNYCYRLAQKWSHLKITIRHSSHCQ